MYRRGIRHLGANNQCEVVPYGRYDLLDMLVDIQRRVRTIRYELLDMISGCAKCWMLAIPCSKSNVGALLS